MAKLIIVVLVLIVILGISCKGPEGPVGPQGPPGRGIESLTDPSIMPTILSTYPPANSHGPYDPMQYPQIQIRFNKIMDRESIRRAVSITSNLRTIRIDSSSIYSIGGDIYVLYPADSALPYYLGFLWKVGEMGTLKINSSARDINGNFLQPQYSMTIQPEPFFRVTRVYPSNGATEIYSYTGIRLRFNSPVDASIRSLIQINPPIPGRWVYDDIYADSMSLYYSNSSPLLTNTTYTITVNSTAKDKYGNQLPQSFISTFKTMQFKITDTYPSNGSTDVEMSSPVSVYFSAPIDISTVRSSFSINPHVAGDFTMYSGSYSFIYYHFGFLADTTYTVTIDTSIRSMNGEKLSSPYQFSFKTAPFRVGYNSPYNGRTNVARYLSSVSLNEKIDTSTIRTAFSIPGVTGYFSFYDGGSYFYFNPTNTPLAANTIYTATISTALRSKSGARLKSPYTFSFITGN